MNQKIVFFTLDITLQGGIERVVSNLANKFSNENYIVEVISFFKQNDKIYYPFNSNVKIVFLSETSFFQKGLKNKFINYVLLFNGVRDYLNSNTGVIIISTFVNISIYCGILKFYYKNALIIASEHSQYFAHNFAIRGLRRIFYNKMNSIVTLTNHDYEIFKKRFKKSQLCVIPNPLMSDCEEQASLRNKILISAGRLNPVKGFDNLIEAFNILKNKHIEWKLEIYGDGSEYDKLYSLIVKNNLKERVFLKGYNDNIKEAFLQASIFVCSSKTEAFPMAMLEALSVGLPVISYNCPVGPREIIISEFNGYLVENQNVIKLSETLSFLMSNNEKLKILGDNAYVDTKKYSEDYILPKWENLFNQIKTN